MSDMTQPAVTTSTLHPKPRFARGLLGWVLFIGLAIMLFMLMQNNGARQNVLPLSEFKQRLELNLVRSVEIESSELHGELVFPRAARTTEQGENANRFRTPLPDGMGSNWEFVNWILDHRGDAVVTARGADNVWLNILLPIVPWLLIFAFIWFVVFRQLCRGSICATSRNFAQPGPGRWVPDPSPDPPAPPNPPPPNSAPPTAQS